MPGVITEYIQVMAANGPPTNREDLNLLRNMSQQLMLFRGDITHHVVFSPEPNALPTVMLEFGSRHIMMNLLWCRYFWSRFQPQNGPPLIMTARAFDPVRKIVALTPRKDGFEEHLAREWLQTAASDPLANPFTEVTFGFHAVGTHRTVRLLRLQ